MTGATPEADAERANEGARASRVARVLGAIVGGFTLVRERYVELTDAAKARVRPVGEALRRAQLRFLAATDRWKERAVAMPHALRDLGREPDDVEQLRRRLGGVGIALFTVLAIGSLAVLKPAGRSADRSASGPATGRAPSGPAATSTSGPSTPTTRPATSTSTSTTIPGAVATPERSPHRSALRDGVAPSAGRGPAVVGAAASPTSAAVATSPEAPPLGGGPTTTRPTLPTPPATSPTTSTPGRTATTTSPTTTATPPAPSPPAAAPVLTFDLALDGDGFDGSFCLFGVDLFGGACEGGR